MLQRDKPLFLWFWESKFIFLSYDLNMAPHTTIGMAAARSWTEIPVSLVQSLRLGVDSFSPSSMLNQYLSD